MFLSIWVTLKLSLSMLSAQNKCKQSKLDISEVIIKSDPSKPFRPKPKTLFFFCCRNIGASLVFFLLLHAAVFFFFCLKSIANLFLSTVAENTLWLTIRVRERMKNGYKPKIWLLTLFVCACVQPHVVYCMSMCYQYFESGGAEDFRSDSLVEFPVQQEVCFLPSHAWLQRTERRLGLS